ncbi:MAG: DUF2019 domain-containing protein [Rhizobiaceae bacterium]|jgi:hypothetical protein
MMKGLNPASLTDAELAERFAQNGIAQSEALLRNSSKRFNRIFDENSKIIDELKGRPGDARSALISLYGHRNYQVRLNAAQATLSIAPDQARRQIEEIASSKHFPQAGDAGMCLWMLDEGMFKPR